MHKVHCHSQEYWTLSRMTCSCGAPFTRNSVGIQSLQAGPHGPMDVLRVTCEGCGHQNQFEFDISSFFGKPDSRSYQELLRDQQRIWEMFVWHELPMESVLKYLSDLAEKRDADALEYVLAASREFLQRARAATPTPSS